MLKVTCPGPSNVAIEAEYRLHLKQAGLEEHIPFLVVYVKNLKFPRKLKNCMASLNF